MKFMVMVKADKHSEAGEMPSEQLLADMGKFNESLVKAGVMLAARIVIFGDFGKAAIATLRAFELS